VVTTISDLGLYALMGTPLNVASFSSGRQALDDICGGTSPSGHKIYLPVVLKNGS
jgi:hypothetical protein